MKVSVPVMVGSPPRYAYFLNAEKQLIAVGFHYGSRQDPPSGKLAKYQDILSIYHLANPGWWQVYNTAA